MKQAEAETERERERAYLRMLKRRQRVSLLLQWASILLVLGAIVLFLSSLPRARADAESMFWLAVGLLVLAMVCQVIEAIDGAIEHRRRTERAQPGEDIC